MMLKQALVQLSLRCVDPQCSKLNHGDLYACLCWRVEIADMNSRAGSCHFVLKRYNFYFNLLRIRMSDINFVVIDTYFFLFGNETAFILT